MDPRSVAASTLGSNANHNNNINSTIGAYWRENMNHYKTIKNRKPGNTDNVYKSFQNMVKHKNKTLAEYFKNQRARHAKNNAAAAAELEEILGKVSAVEEPKKPKKPKKTKKSKKTVFGAEDLQYTKDSGRLYAKIKKWCEGKTKKQIEDEFARLKKNPELVNAYVTDTEKELMRNGETLDLLKEIYNIEF